jgi:hypothetical protein
MPVDKDRVMKLIQIVDDIGADRGIIITTSSYTPSAIKTAEKRNIELWNRDKLAKVIGEIELSASKKGIPQKIETNLLCIKPKITENNTKTYVMGKIEKLRKGGFLGIGKRNERLEKIELAFYPHYDLELQTTVLEKQKTGLLSSRVVEKTVVTKISVDAVSGAIAVVEDGEIISYPFAYLSQLDDEEIQILKNIPSTFNMNTVLALGFSESKARKTIRSLVGKGIIGETNTRPVYYSLRVNFPNSPTDFKSLSEIYTNTRELIPEDDTFPIKQTPDAIIKAVEMYWDKTTVKTISTIYYPYYVISYIEEDGSKRLEFFDAIISEVNEQISGIPKL